MLSAAVTAIVGHLPSRVLGNEELAMAFEGWSAEKIFEKTGVRERRIAADGETAGDLGEAAARRLFETQDIAPASIDMLIFCTQAPDYLLPATACILHERLGLRRDCGAFDYSLGCSGFVYGLALAQGLVAAGSARRVLLVTADTYSKLLHPRDRSVRTLFGDGAAATLIEASSQPGIGPFVFGADGRGANNLIVPTGGARRARTPETAAENEDSSGNVRSLDNLYMNGAEVMAFTLGAVPTAVRQLLERSETTLEDYDLFVFHQANAFMLERLRRKLGIDPQKFIVALERCGNTVSSTIPLALEPLIRAGGMGRRRAMLVGFGVGYSWAATSLEFGKVRA
jgi:3-oxoacyl-[acyl-carrier-protein] synthase-3